MSRFLVRYTHVQEVVYEDWVEADSEEEAISSVEENPNFEEELDVQGIEFKDFEVVDEE